MKVHAYHDWPSSIQLMAALIVAVRDVSAEVLLKLAASHFVTVLRLAVHRVPRTVCSRSTSLGVPEVC